MQKNFLVSIIINNYNYDRFLAQAIDSALNQTYPHTEVIVVDDGSTDNSREIIAGYGDRIIPILQPNGKQAAAFNSGLKRSLGDILIFLDSDDYLYPQAVERIVEVWQPNLSKVHYRLEVVDADRQSLGYTFPQGSEPLSTGEVWQTLLSYGGYVRVPTSGNALNRNALLSIFPIPDEFKLTADDYLSVLVPFAGEVGAVEDPLGAYRIHGSNQWALATVTSDRFHRFIKHDQVVYKLLVDKAEELGYKLPQDFELRSLGRYQVRLASVRLTPEKHPIPQDRILYLVYSGIKSIWKYSTMSWQKKFIYTVWFLWIGFVPLTLAKPAITWFFTPHFRPKLLKKIYASV
ncbi:glycosyltransferase [Anabaena azotica]|uniref:Glycosyltransferase n=1 Tax=Anabaena azotica FACHB-119 TaxID=947527 RepID=A0ABR8D442_9NOST|nr:glycosyltransferase [Anabaena azotica]MBD2501915.1 glycosyltransferase [Anabaena azotica FACHB-119]